MTLETQVKQLISDTLLIGTDHIEEGTNLVTELEVDSLRALEVIAALEQRWNVMFAEEKFAEMVSVRAIADELRALGVEG